MLQLNGEKMSKSLGNVVWLRELIARNRQMAFRLQVLQTHYRSPLNFTEAGLEAAQAGLDRLIAAAEPEPQATADNQVVTGDNLAVLAAEADLTFHDAMDADFNTPVAVAAQFELSRSINRMRSQAGGTAPFRAAQEKLIELAGILGLELLASDPTPAGDAAPFIDLLVEVRASLRASRQWEAADLIRVGLHERGIALEDAPTGTTWKKQ
jgi:cysteinyl-tRNA synthetase